MSITAPVAGANAYWSSPFRYREQRYESGVTLLFRLGSTRV